MHATQTDQVGVFPCRGLVAPCQRTASSIEVCRFDVNGRGRLSGGFNATDGERALNLASARG